MTDNRLWDSLDLANGYKPNRFLETMYVNSVEIIYLIVRVFVMSECYLLFK